MGDSYEVEVVTTLLAGATTEWTKTVTADDTLTEEFRAVIRLAIAAADVNVKINALTDPKVLVVAGGKGVTFKLDSTGVDPIGADPIAVVSDEGSGLGIDELLLSNGDTVEHSVTIIAFE